MNPDINAVIHAESTFAPVPTGILRSDATSRAVVTYAVLRTYVRPGRQTFPKFSTMAEQFGLSESFLKRGVAELRDLGFLVVTKKDFAAGFRQVNCYYFPNIPDGPVTSDQPEGVRSDTSVRVTPDTSVKVTGDTLYEVEETEVEEVEVERDAPAAAVALAQRKSTPKPRAKASRLPEGWMPRQNVIEQMRAECPQVNLEAEHRKFCDHWAAASGEKATKLDWNATWRNWIRRAAEHDQRSNTYTPSWQKRLDANVQAAQADMNRDRGIFEIGE